MTFAADCIRHARPRAEFLRSATDRKIKVTIPGPFTMAQQAQNDHYETEEEVAFAFADVPAGGPPTRRPADPPDAAPTIHNGRICRNAVPCPYTSYDNGRAVRAAADLFSSKSVAT